ncbi:metallophosphoesterase family protein [Sagittula salina]|uniref:Metallophosphoesterase n=1 Tax=Sagittula salina TaxID=2820268 RepID=A0A940MU84_9RHOB|nr:metallophosphoesterase family protein [Sagittula salina]MBP0483044.1 metallophosphoesterase [Sagittula salina]
MAFVSQEVEAGAGPWLVFGGPVSNWHAVRALRAEAARLKIPPERVLCTGDLAAYCGDPGRTVAEIRDWSCHVVAGNCERQLASGASDCGCGFETGTTCDALSGAWYAHAAAELDAEARAWMAGLPDEIVMGEAVAIHGGWTDISRFLWPITPEDAFAEELAERARLTCNPAPHMVLAGHCGLSFTRRIAGTTWVNAGTLGMPPHDGRPETCYVILDGGTVRHRRLDYDWRSAQARMRAVGLVQGYDTTLETGWWPSEDILPHALCRRS